MKGERLRGLLFMATLVLVLLPVPALAATTHRVGTETELAAALSSAVDGDTIQLTDSIIYTDPITMEGKSLTFDVGMHTLDIDVNASANYALMVDTGTLTLVAEPGGALNVTTANVAIGVCVGSGEATVTNITVETDPGTNLERAAVATYGVDSRITVTGNVSVTGDDSSAVRTYGDNLVTIGGNVSAMGDNISAVYTPNGGQITIRGNISAAGDDAIGVFVWDDSTVTVGGSISATGNNATGVSAWDDSTVTAGGDISAVGDFASGVSTSNNGKVTLDGNVWVSNGENTGDQQVGSGVAASDTSAVIIGGSVLVEGVQGYGAQASESGTIHIAKNVMVTDPTVDADIGYGSCGVAAGGYEGEIGCIVTVAGDVTVTGAGSIGAAAYGGTITVNGSVSSVGNKGVGAMAVTDGFVTIEGELSAQNYACVNARAPYDSGDSEALRPEVIIRSKSEGSDGEGDHADYLIYTDTDAEHSGDGYAGAGTVYINRNASGEEILLMPTVVTGAVTDVTASCATLNGDITSDGGATVTERGFVYGKTTDLAIDGAGVTDIAAGRGMGSFTATLNNLEKNSIYYVRAYAVNSQGTAYGTAVSFSPTSSVEEIDAPTTGNDAGDVVSSGDISDARNLAVISVLFVVGLSGHYGFAGGMVPVFGAKLPTIASAALVGILLDLLLSIGKT